MKNDGWSSRKSEEGRHTHYHAETGYEIFKDLGKEFGVRADAFILWKNYHGIPFYTLKEAKAWHLEGWKRGTWNYSVDYEGDEKDE